MIKEVEIKANGGPEQILWKDCELDKLSPGQVTIKHTFVGLNFIDTYHRSGLYPLPLPTKLGMEGAGVIVDKSSDVNEYEIGDRVAYVMVLGSYASKRNIDASKLVKVPKSISDQQAAAILLKGLELGCVGIITATTNVTGGLARQVYDNFHNKQTLSSNQNLCDVRICFDKYNLISGLHTLMAEKNSIYENLLPPLKLLDEAEKKDLFSILEKLNFNMGILKAA